MEEDLLLYRGEGDPVSERINTGSPEGGSPLDLSLTHADHLYQFEEHNEPDYDQPDIRSHHPAGSLDGRRQGEG